jgi:hypothetical protein
VTVTRGPDGTAALHGTTFTVTLVHGVATFSNLFYTKAEAMNMTFSTNASVVKPANSADVTVMPAASDRLVITRQPSATATVGVVFNRQPIVAEEDQYGNVITSDSTDTVTAARGSLGTGALAGGPLTITLQDGVATFTGLSYDTAETMNIVFTSNLSNVSSVTSANVVVGAGGHVMFRGRAIGIGVGTGRGTSRTGNLALGAGPKDHAGTSGGTATVEAVKASPAATDAIGTIIDFLVANDGLWDVLPPKAQTHHAVSSGVPRFWVDRN